MHISGNSYLIGWIGWLDIGFMDFREEVTIVLNAFRMPSRYSTHLRHLSNYKQFVCDIFTQHFQLYFC